MWTLAGNGTNTGLSNAACAIATISGEDKGFPLCEKGKDIPTVDILLPSPPPLDGQIIIPAPVEEVVAIEAGGVAYVLSPTPDNPMPGEFVIKDNQIVITTKQPAPLAGMSLVLKTAPEIIRTDYVNPALFLVFAGLPVVGTLSWTRSLEQHPSGSANLSVLQSGIAACRSRFRKGNEVEFAGIGFSVSSYNDRLLSTHEYPGGLYEVSISFTGKWNRNKYNIPVLYKGGAGTITGQNNRTTIQDPDCVNPANTNTSTSAKTITVLSQES